MSVFLTSTLFEVKNFILLKLKLVDFCWLLRWLTLSYTGESEAVGGVTPGNNRNTVSL